MNSAEDFINTEYSKKYKNIEQQTEKENTNIIPRESDDEFCAICYDEFEDIKNYFSELFKCYQDYKIQWPFLDKTLDVVDIPKFNIQKYDIGGHFSSVHCERDSKQNMHRIFAWMTYLNDVDEGGETCFEHFDLKVKPITGQTLIWPAEWTHAHKGEVLLKGNKYIITGWMHFPFNFQVPQKV